MAGQDNLLRGAKRALQTVYLNLAHDGTDRGPAAFGNGIKGIIHVLGADSKPIRFRANKLRRGKIKDNFYLIR